MRRHFCYLWGRRSRVINKESGAVYPIVLLICSIALIILFEATLIYLSELGFVREMKEYYLNEIREQLIQ